jgi:hypothetical protein
MTLHPSTPSLRRINGLYDTSHTHVPVLAIAA